MLGLYLFRSAGTTGQVFTISGKTPRNRGIGWSGWIGPTTVLAVVPTIPQVIHFSQEVYTQDRQMVRVTGNVQVQLQPEVVRSVFDFTVNRYKGNYEANWQADLQSILVEQTLSPIREAARVRTLADAVVSQAQFEALLQAAIAAQGGVLANRGIQVTNCSISQVAPAHSDLAEAVGAVEREKLLAEADSARSRRRQEAAANERSLKQYEAETRLKLEEARAALVAQQGENDVAAAGYEARATDTRLAPMAAMQPASSMAAALILSAEKGALSNVSLTTDLLTILNGGDA